MTKFRQVPLPTLVSCCITCGALIEPSARSRADHERFHASIGEKAAIDLTAEEQAPPASTESLDQA